MSGGPAPETTGAADPATVAATRARPAPAPSPSALSVVIGAAFLMATSAIGPGFLTQTTVFTERVGASFGFAILISILFDLGAQLNIWRVIAVTERRAQDVANQLLPGLGHALIVLVVLGGLAFNIGNVAGAGLGLNALLGVPTLTGAIISAGLAIAIFLVREAGRAMDRFTQVMGFVMVALTVYVAVASRPPIGAAIVRSVLPTRIDVLTIVTLVGGTVGGYITFAGAHRLLDAGIARRTRLGEVMRSAGSGIGIASIMRVVLFLAALGIVAQGLALDEANPPASVFRLAAGEIGYRVFGLVMWAAAITSVVGSAYTSVSFLRSLGPAFDRRWREVTIVFIALSTVVFAVVGRPVKTLILVGALNGLILPISLGVMLVEAHRRSIVGTYRHPVSLTVAGSVVAAAMASMGVWAMVVGMRTLF